MNDFLIRQYTRVSDTIPFLRKIKYYAAIRFFIRLIANVILPVWFRISAVFVNGGLNKADKRDKKIIVSLTTFPARIGRIWIVVECMLRQSVKPDRIILWLSQDQFPSENSLPKKLLALKKRGLEIVLCEGDIRSHKKYYYSLQQFPDDDIITVDDDLLYPSYLIEELVSLRAQFPEAIACHRALEIRTEEDNVIRYNKLRYICEGKGPGHNVFFTTGGGTLFSSANFVYQALDKDVFMEYCRYADDVWLNMMAQFKDTKIVKSGKHFEPIPVYNFGNTTLSSVNVDEGLNDKQISEVIAHYSNTYSIRSFYNPTIF